MSVKRIGWQGATRSRHLRGHLELGLTRWQQGWFSEPLLGARIRAMDEAKTPVLEELKWWTLNREGATVYFGACADIDLLLGADVLRLAPLEDSRLIRGVGARCFAELCCSLWGGAEMTDLAPSPAPDLCNADERYGGLACEVDGLPDGLWVLVTRSWCDRFGPDRIVSSASLTNRSDAFGTTGVKVSASIELGTMALSDSMNWTVGEVLVTDAPIQSPVTLNVAARRVASGNLTETAGVRAVRVA